MVFVASVKMWNSSAKESAQQNQTSESQIDCKEIRNTEKKIMISMKRIRNSPKTFHKISEN